MTPDIFKGCIPALMTPCSPSREPDTVALVAKAQYLMEMGMNGVVYCGSMGDWPLLTDRDRQNGVAELSRSGVPVVVGTGAQNTKIAAEHAAHAQSVGAAGLMVIPRVLSRGTSPAAQSAHFAAVLSAAPKLPAVIYNSPYYGFETKSELFFQLRDQHPNLVGFKEFGGQDALTDAAEHITQADDDLVLMAGVDTQVYHGFVRCGAVGAITGIGNCLPAEVLHLVRLCRRAAAGDASADRMAVELSNAFSVLAGFDEGPDLVLYYKFLLFLLGDPEYELHFNSSDALSPSQRAHAESQLSRFRSWYADWSAQSVDD
ncbi:MAG: dihydrodipicolinate synthase family protein [Planctomycetota bacterium]